MIFSGEERTPDGTVVTVSMPERFRIAFDPKCHQLANVGGRDCGKTKNGVLLILVMMMAHPNTDWIFLKAHFSDFRATDYSEVVSAINEAGFSSEFTVCQTPLRATRRNGAGMIYFYGADSSDVSRTHGIKTMHKLGGVVFSESQQFRSQNVFDEAMASIRRNFTDPKTGRETSDWKIIVQFNPPKSSSHWINVWALQKRNDPDWTVLDMTYLDILPFLNDIDLTEIRKEKYLDPESYEWRYMGKVGGGWGTCYPMLTEKFHLVKSKDAMSESGGMRVVAIVIGADGAVNRDATSFCPWLVLEDGTMWARSDEQFYYDPKRDGVMASWQMCDNSGCQKGVNDNNGGPAWKWWYGFKDRYGGWHPGICNKYPSIANGSVSVPIWFFVDPAAAELVQAIRFFFGNRSSVYPAKKSSIMSMAEVCQNAFGKGLARFIDAGGRWEYYPAPNLVNPTREPVWVEHSFPLWDQFVSLRFDSKGMGYDDTIPNDASDSGTYGIWSFFKNPQNIVFGDIVRKKDV